MRSGWLQEFRKKNSLKGDLGALLSPYIINDNPFKGRSVARLRYSTNYRSRAICGLEYSVFSRFLLSAMSEQVYYLPDTLRNWPWHRIQSPHYREAQAESVAWLESFHPFTPAAQKAFNKCDFSRCSYLLLSPRSMNYTGLVSALTFPRASLCKESLTRPYLLR